MKKFYYGLIASMTAFMFFSGCSHSEESVTRPDDSEKEHSSDAKDISSSSVNNEELSSSGKDASADDLATLGEFMDERDGQYYRTVILGEQTWMAQNLNYDGGEWRCPSGSQESDESCKKYGKLYYYSGLNYSDLSSLCPSGWYVPNSSDWGKLLTYVDENNGKEGVGKSLKASEGWFQEGYKQIDESTHHERVAVAAGDNRFGFYALPAGSCWQGGTVCYTNDETRFWSVDDYSACGIKLSFDSDSVMYDEDAVYGYITLRCIKKVDLGDFKEVDLGDCDKTNDGEMKYGSTGYICDGGKWRNATNLEMDLDVIGKCNASNEYSNSRGKYGEYRCMADGWHEIIYGGYVGESCSDDGKMLEDDRSGDYDICEDGVWQYSKSSKDDIRFTPCDKYGAVTTSGEYSYLCGEDSQYGYYEGNVWLLCFDDPSLGYCS